MHAILTMAPAQPSLAPALEAGLARVEDRFRRQLETSIPSVAELVRHVERYRGKMLRPTLLLLCARACDPAAAEFTDDQVVAATVVEMIHMATLVHDDVLDEADVRRGGDTVNKRRGNEAAVILGDYLIAKSFHLCSGLQDQRTALRIGEITSIVCEGEMLQNAHRGDFEIPRQTYFEIIERKTAALIAVACEQGAVHAGAPESVQARLFDYGRLLGSAFQIQDDLLDLVGDEAVVGKSLGRDLQKGTLTLPMIYFLESLTQDARQGAIEAIRSGAALNGHRSAFIGGLEAAGAIAAARTTAVELTQRAKSLLGPLTPSPAKDLLLSMADAVVSRAF